MIRQISDCFTSNLFHNFAVVGVPFSITLTITKPADAAVGVVRGIAVLASPTAKL